MPVDGELVKVVVVVIALVVATGDDASVSVGESTTNSHVRKGRGDAEQRTPRSHLPNNLWISLPVCGQSLAGQEKYPTSKEHGHVVMIGGLWASDWAVREYGTGPLGLP